ncbi:MAG: response regulator [Thermoanaerobaculia bacterium]
MEAIDTVEVVEAVDVKRALVIDDDSDIRELLTMLLEASGFAVETMTDGIDAIRLTKDYAVILLDMNMPIFDGARLTDYWQLTDPSILDRVIVISGYSRFARGRDLATFATVPKPFDCGELMQVIHNCVEQQRQSPSKEQP